MAINNAKTQDLKISVVEPMIKYFVDPVRGRLPKPDTNYVLISQPQGIPSYSISNVQDFYLTPTPDAFIIPIFITLPEIFFSEFDQYHTITVVDQLRLDLIAHIFYEQVEYWWIIALANDIADPFDIPLNKILRIPSQEVILNKWLQRPIRRRRTSSDFTLS